MTGAESSAAVIPVDQDLVERELSPAANDSLLLRHIVEVTGALAILTTATYLLAGRAVDLLGFIGAVFVCGSIGLLGWRLYVLWLVLQERHHPATPIHDPLRGVATLPLWRDGIVCLLLFAALAGNLAMFAYVSDRYAWLPPFLPLHYSAAGEVDRLGTPNEVFMIPAIGAVLVIANVIIGAVFHRRERGAAILLAAACVFAQILLFVATTNIVSRA